MEAWQGQEQQAAGLFKRAAAVVVVRQDPNQYDCCMITELQKHAA